MAHVVVIEKNKNGKIELTQEELQKMLDTAYEDGRADGSRHSTITYPSNTREWWTTTNPITITCDSTKAAVSNDPNGVTTTTLQN